MQRTLVVYYSMTGNTRHLAEEIRTAVAGDLEEIREPRPRRGFSGVVRALLDLALRREVPIEPIRHSPSDYALVILGGPVWGGRIAPPVRTYALRHGLQASQVAFFCTMGGRGAESAFAGLAKDCGRDPVATLALDSAHLDPAAHALDLQRFAGSSHPAPV